jgi:hypothetical protein
MCCFYIHVNKRRVLIQQWREKTCFGHEEMRYWENMEAKAAVLCSEHSAGAREFINKTLPS